MKIKKRFFVWTKFAKRIRKASAKEVLILIFISVNALNPYSYKGVFFDINFRASVNICANLVE